MKTQKLASILLMGLFIIGIAIPMQAQQSSKPNVVIMLSDNMGYGDLGCYGSGGELRGMPTPRIDQTGKRRDHAHSVFRGAGLYTDPRCFADRQIFSTCRIGKYYYCRYTQHTSG